MSKDKASLSGIFGLIFFGFLALLFFFLDMRAIALGEIEWGREVPFLTPVALGFLAYISLKMDTAGA